MIRHETHEEIDEKHRFFNEDTLWIITGVLISLSLLAVVYFALTLFTAY